MKTYTLEECRAIWEAYEALPLWRKMLRGTFWRRLHNSLLWALWIPFRDRWITKPHLLDMRGKAYKGGYSDPCHQLLCASMRILQDFVEKEMFIVDWNGSSDAHVAAAKEMRTIYYWWILDRPAQEKKLYGPAEELGDFHNLSAEERAEEARRWMKAEEEFDAKDEEMLIRLAKIRKFLWT